jgi:hypothetical protein
MVEGIKLEINMGEQEIIATQYKQVVYKLIHLINSRLDIIYVINVVSRFMVKPQKPHMQTIKKILKHLRGTLDFNIIYCKSENVNLFGLGRRCRDKKTHKWICVHTRNITYDLVSK